MSPSTITLREMKADDVPAMAKLESVVSPRPWSADLFAGELSMTATERYWVVAVDPLTDELVGFGGVMFVAADGRIVEGHIMNVAVDPQRQGLGLGSRLLAQIMSEAKQCGAESLTLEVRVGNQPALALYRRVGFAPVGVRSGYYGTGEDALVMWLHDLQAIHDDTIDAGKIDNGRADEQGATP